MTSIVLVGLGPRGLAVLDSLVRRLAERPIPATLHLVDPAGPGLGPVWGTGQPDYLLMNTEPSEATLFPQEDRAGTDFASWLGPGVPPGVRPRAEYGGYLRWAYDRILGGLPHGVTAHRVRRTAVHLAPAGRGFVVRLDDGTSLAADQVVVCVGYGTCAEVASPGLAALDAVDAGRPVGMLGLGLGFFDLMAAATLGRNGRFEQVGSGLKYLPSGEEPVLYAGCRSGVPAKSKVSAAYLGRVRPAVVTDETVRAALAEPDPITGLLDLLDEEFHVSRATAKRVSLRELLDPFRGRTFSSPAVYRAAAAEIVAEDLAEADLPWSAEKAALAAVRSCREIIRRAVEFDWLRDPGFRARFRSVRRLFSSLVGGPPASRVREFAALVDADVVRLVGPDTEAVGDQTIRSPPVDGSLTTVDRVIRARLPEPEDVWAGSPLLCDIRDLFGGTEVLPDCTVADHTGSGHGRVHVIGYPTEGTRWLTQVGCAPPGSRTALTEDADVIARGILH